MLGNFNKSGKITLVSIQENLSWGTNNKIYFSMSDQEIKNTILNKWLDSERKTDLFKSTMKRLPHSSDLVIMRNL